MLPLEQVLRPFVLIIVVVTLATTVAIPSAPASDPAPPPFALDERGAVKVEIQNVNLLLIHRLRGALLPTSPTRPPVFDDKEPFVLRIDTGKIAMSTATLTTLMNNYVFAYRKAPIKNLEITTEKGRLEQEGVLHKGVDIPFKVKAELLTTPNGRIRVHARSIKAAGLPMKPLMNLLGIEMDDMVKIQAGRGIVVDGNDFILAPQQMLPAAYPRERHRGAHRR